MPMIGGQRYVVLLIEPVNRICCIIMAGFRETGLDLAGPPHDRLRADLFTPPKQKGLSLVARVAAASGWIDPASERGRWI